MRELRVKSQEALVSARIATFRRKNIVVILMALKYVALFHLEEFGRVMGIKMSREQSPKHLV